MGNVANFVTVKVARSFERLNKAIETYRNPQRGGWRPRISVGFVLYGFPLLRAFGSPLVAKLPVVYWLAQVSSVLDNRKPRGQVFVFERGFFFCFLYFTVLTRFLFLCFLLAITY